MKVVIISLILLAALSFIILASATNMIEIKANILASAEYLEIQTDEPKINFGTITKGSSSEEEKVCINNTGSKNVSIYLEAQNSPEDDFLEFLFARDVGALTSSRVKISQFATDIKITNSSLIPQRCIWLSLNLTNYPEEIYRNFPDYTTEIKITAVPQ